MKKRCEHDNLADGIFPASSASTSAEVSFTNTLASLRAPLPLSRLRMVPAAVLLTLSLGACGGGSDTAPPNPESGMPPGTQLGDASQATGTPAASASSQATNNNESNPSSISSAGSTVTNNTQNSSGSNTTNATNTATGGSTGTTGNASGGTAQTNTSSPTPTAGTQSGNGTSTGGTAQSPATPAPGATGTPPATGTQPTPATGSTQASGTTPTNGTQTPDASAGDMVAQQPPASHTGAQTNPASQAGSATGGGNTDSTQQDAGTPVDTPAQGGGTQAPATPDAGQNTNQLPAPAPFPPVSESICKDILAGNLALPVGMNKLPMRDVARPAVGTALKDEQHGSCIVRITDQAGKTPANYWRHGSPNRQAFNADSSLLLLSSDTGKWQIVDARTGEAIKQLNAIVGEAEPHWHPTDPKRISLLTAQGASMKLYSLDVEQDKATEIADMNDAVKTIWPDAQFTWTRGTGSPSTDHRYWCLLAEKDQGGSRMPLGLFTWDAQENRLVGHTRLSRRPEQVMTSPSGEYCVISSVAGVSDYAFKRDFSAPFNAQTGTHYLEINKDGESNSGAVVRNASGDDVYVGTSYASATGEVFSLNLKTGERKMLFNAFIDGTQSGNQFSAHGLKKPGWVLVSSYAEGYWSNGTYNLRGARDAERQWLHRRVFALNLDNPAQVHAIAHMRNDYQNNWLAPNAVVNADFTKMLFNSTWDGDREADMDTYLVEIPPNAIPAN